MIKKLIRSILIRNGYDIIKLKNDSVLDGLPVDFSPLERNIIKKVKPFTMTSPERMEALIQAISYLHTSGIQGSIVECGVWKGGSMMAAILSLMEFNDLKRPIYLYDTFEGMPDPTALDESFQGKPAADLMEQQDRLKSDSVWCFSTLEEVKTNIGSLNYPSSLIHFIKGKVEDTLPETLPESIALLRLDTDWYESTRHELENLFPLLVPGGVLIIDDYGHWKGARKAVDEYFEKNNIPIMLNRIDYTGRIGIKP